MRKGIITFLVDRKEIRNWQPLSLLKAEYKILSKVIANQVRFVQGSVIPNDQTCAEPGRKISESITLLRDLIVYFQNRGVEACLISLYQEKAFDRILQATAEICSPKWLLDQMILHPLYHQDRLSEGGGNLVGRGHGIVKNLGGAYCQ
eukprot:g26820.t1